MKTLSQIRELISEKKKHEEKMCDDCGKTSKACECSDMKEELSAKQKQLDKNHNGKLDKQDFEMLRSMKEESKKQKKYEDSEEDEKEDKKMEKKYGMTHAEWEKSEMDKKQDKKHMEEKAPPGWEGTIKAMKKHKGIDNPWALAWSMKNKGMKSHKKD